MDRIKRTKYVIRPSFQIRWALLMATIGAVVAAVFSAGLWISLDEHIELLNRLQAVDEKLKNESQDLLMVLYNLTDRSAEEKEKYIARFDELDKRFAESRREKHSLISKIQQARYFVILVVFLIGAFLFVWGIFLTHRVAGPLHVIRTQLEKLEAEGKITARPLRKKDEFKDDYAVISEILQRLSST